MKEGEGGREGEGKGDGGRERGRERKREEGKQSKEWVSDPLIQNEGIHKSQAGCGR